MSYVVTVNFTIDPLHAAAFMVHMVQNARTSVDVEPGCRQFDVCRSASNANRIFLYEVYDDRAAFDAHLASSHFQTFDKQVADWVVAKYVELYNRED